MHKFLITVKYGQVLRKIIIFQNQMLSYGCPSTSTWLMFSVLFNAVVGLNKWNLGASGLHCETQNDIFSQANHIAASIIYCSLLIFKED